MIEAKMDYGYISDSFTGYLIFNKAIETFVINRNCHSVNMLPADVPVTRIYDILNNGIVTGNACLVDLCGFTKMVTVAHNVYNRGDGLELPPGEWSERPVENVISVIFDKLKRKWDTNVFSEQGYLYLEVVEV